MFNFVYFSFTLASGVGNADLGMLPHGRPTVSLFLSPEDLSSALGGRLDLVDAVARRKARVTGDLVALAKLKHLIQLQPASNTGSSTSASNPTSLELRSLRGL
ncbi:unnamed protein product [Protopolystoma xenopodis]|uniref:SCP2 domain-containing protein n=1 Tax=Protopolystoma xenopodis TaxID=117903 RepID=A0A3S5B4K0_9PLAT|nr:unnamed protein product [Protopolystoma xenopodis]